MSPLKLARLGLSAGSTVLLAASMAHAGPLDFLNQFFVDIFNDISTFLITLGAIAFMISVIMMMFGVANAWKAAVIAVLFIIAVNALKIMGVLSGY